MTYPLIVVLRFASGIRVDLVDGLSEEEAIADFTARSLRTGAVELPLYEARTAAVPMQRLRDLAGIKTRAAAPIIQRPSVSLVGMIGAVRGYTSALSVDRSEGAVTAARQHISDFFDHYGIDIDFRVAPPMAKQEVSR